MHATHRHTIGTHTLAAYSNVATNTTAIPSKNRWTFSDCPSSQCFISVIFQAHLGASCLRQSWLSSCRKILLTVHMWSTAITLNNSIGTTCTRYTYISHNHMKEHPPPYFWPKLVKVLLMCISEVRSFMLYFTESYYKKALCRWTYLTRSVL